VSVGHISRPEEFKRAFAVATVHDFFNLLSVLVLFPLQLTTNVLGISSSYLGDSFQQVGGMKLLNPLKLIVNPTVAAITDVAAESGTTMFVISIVLLFIALRYIVVNLKQLVIGRVEQFFDALLFKNAARAMLLGLVLTVMVQSSSITTSLVVPLAGAGILTLRQIFPMTLGANIGTTITAILAALVTGHPAAVTVAFAHLLFNVFGIVVIWPIRRIPLYLSETLAEWSIRSKLIPLAYVGLVFFLIPLVLIYFVG
ncbi:MAG: Na/Pi symporter, partial [Acidobacteria bacterium]|nr:Na/Pi symporter [Acidobacteriota bacterium]